MNNDKEESGAPLNPLIMAIVTMVILYLSYYLLLDYARGRAKVRFATCQNNCKKIATALDKFAENNDGKYPETLEQLKGKYIESIPTCPQAEKDPYSETYRVAPDFQSYTFYCRGLNHQVTNGSAADLPLYCSDYGLISWKEDLEKTPRDAIEFAAKMKELPSIKKLLVRKPEIIAYIDDNGENVLFSGVILYKPKILEYLISKGAEINIKSYSGSTPLHKAVEEGDADAVRILIRSGAEINSPDNRSITPLHLAVENGNQEICRVLVSNGADINAGEKGNTPVDLAVKDNQDTILKILREQRKEGADK